MNWIRNALIGGILIVIFLLFIRWTEFQEQPAVALAPEASTNEYQASDIPNTPDTNNASVEDDLPSAPSLDGSEQVNIPTAAPSSQLINVNTDTLTLKIDPLGGDIVSVSLPQYLSSLDEGAPALTLLNRSASSTYIAQSDLVGPNGTHTKASRSLYSSQSSSYRLDEGDDSLVVDLFLNQGQTRITKRFTFSRDSYLINVEYIINNGSSETWKAAMYGRIKRDAYEPETKSSFIGVQPYLGAALTTKDDKYKKVSFDDLDDESFSTTEKGGWVAMLQHYFIGAWVPNANETNNYKLYKSKDRSTYLLQYTGPLHTVAPGQTDSITSAFYVGPKIIRNLEAVSPYLDLTIDFSWLWFIAKPLFLALDFIQGFVGNWGIAIILLTFLVKLIFLYPSAMSYRSMAKMRKIMPQMQELKERYGDDRQRMGVETMKMYKKEGVNPLGGCLPMLMQMPVFLALYWALMESVELRHSPFFFWITDLSFRDPYFVLPILYGVAMFFQQKLNPAPQDPMQAKVMQMLPIFITFLFMMFPSGLVLYWLTNTLLSAAQQYMITRQIEKS